MFKRSGSLVLFFLLVAAQTTQAEVTKAWKLVDNETRWVELDLTELSEGVNSGRYIIDGGEKPVVFSVASMSGKASAQLHVYDTAGTHGAFGKAHPYVNQAAIEGAHIGGRNFRVSVYAEILEATFRNKRVAVHVTNASLNGFVMR